MQTVSFNTHFPGYEIIGELGRSNARVLKARHLDTGDLVAIKHIALNTDAETLRRFRLESQLMTDIRHPNVVRVREVQLDRPLPYIVMEWIEGGNLRTLLSGEGRLPVATTVRLGLQMADAFRAIHPAGIIHRDIKPENILYRPLPSGELHFLLADFGVARLREQTQTMTGQSLMTYEYASPEQFDNPRGVDLATDFYSLGVVLYECLAGRVPFSVTDTGMASFVNQVLQAAPPALPAVPGQYVPPSLETAINWLLTKAPADRLSDVDELTLLLSQASVEQLQVNRPGERRATTPTPTRPAPVVPPRSVQQPIPAPPSEPAPRPNAWAIPLSILAVGAMIGFAVWYTGQPRTDRAYVPADSTFTPVDSSDISAGTEDSTTTEPSEAIYSDGEGEVDSTLTRPTPDPTPAEVTTPTEPAPTPDSTTTRTDTTGSRSTGNRP